MCDQVSGQCDCVTGATTQTCSECLPGFFNLTSSGCIPCECSEYALSRQCNIYGQCVCPDGTEGLKCDACVTNFYNISSQGCMECQCDPIGSNTSAQCDIVSGQCVCTGNSVGLNCNMCLDGSFLTNGMTRDRCVECVCSGKTDQCVEDEANFVLGSIQTPFTTLCANNPIDCADGWKLLTESGQPAAPFGPRYTCRFVFFRYYYLLTHSDMSGLGYILLLNDQPMLFAPDYFLGSRLGSYGQTFEMTVSVEDGPLGPGTLLENSTIVR